MNTAKRFQNHRRGILAGMQTAQDLRILLKTRIAQFLYNAMIVMVEDFLLEGEPGSLVDTCPPEEAWHYKVALAKSEVFAMIMTGVWFQLPMGFAVNQTRSYFEYNVYGGPDFLIEELEGMIMQDPRVLDVGALTWDHPDFAEYLDGCWIGSLLDTATLGGMIARQSAKLTASPSYVKNEFYRRDREAIMSLHLGSMPHPVEPHEVTVEEQEVEDTNPG